jgi:GxxExxY protein
MSFVRRKEPEEDETMIVRRSIEFDEETRTKFRMILEMCESVYSGLRKGFAETVYEEGLCIELQERGIQYTRQETIPCLYKNRYVGNIRLDIVLESWLPFIFELKATSSPIQTEERWQLVRYMSRKRVAYGAVVNFSQGLTRGLSVSFVVEQEDGYYMYDLETGEGRRLRDA